MPTVFPVVSEVRAEAWKSLEFDRPPQAWWSFQTLVKFSAFVITPQIAIAHRANPIGPRSKVSSREVTMVINSCGWRSNHGIRKMRVLPGGSRWLKIFSISINMYPHSAFRFTSNFTLMRTLDRPGLLWAGTLG